MPDNDYKNETIAPGFCIAVILKENSAPSRGYVGEVQTTDERGVRLTLVDWVIGNASSWDLYIPWSNIESALVATPEHDLERFGKYAIEWIERVPKNPDTE